MLFLLHPSVVLKILVIFHLYKERKAKRIKVLSKIQGWKEKGQRTRFLVFPSPQGH